MIILPTSRIINFNHSNLSIKKPIPKKQPWKNLALVLGSLLVVGSVASAKEVMPAPTPAPEKVVEYVEKPVIVYRDREVTPAWRPNGSVDVQYRWYGETENKVKGEKRLG